MDEGPIDEEAVGSTVLRQCQSAIPVIIQCKTVGNTWWGESFLVVHLCVASRSTLLRMLWASGPAPTLITSGPAMLRKDLR